MSAIRPFEKKTVQSSNTKPESADDSPEITADEMARAVAFLKGDHSKLKPLQKNRSQDASTPGADARAKTLKAVLDSIPKAAAPQQKTAAGGQPKEASKPKAEAAARDPNAEAVPTHWFSREFAEKHGAKEALVLRYLAYKVRRSKNVRDGKRWFFNPIRELAKLYPYIPKSTMEQLLKRLKADKQIEIGNYNRCGYDRTGWYTVPQQVMDAAEKKKLIRVDVATATESGIAAGVLIENLRHWITQKQKKRKKGDTSVVYHEMSPANLAIDLPFFNLSTIKRALKRLVSKGRIIKHPTLKTSYTLPEMVQDGGPERDKPRSKREMAGSERDNTGAKRDEGGSKRDNDTYYKPLVKTIDNTIRKPFKEEAQASPASFERVHHGEEPSNPSDTSNDHPDSRHSNHQSSPSSNAVPGSAGAAKDAGGDTDAPLTYEQLVAINKGNPSLFQYNDPRIHYQSQPKDDPGIVARDIVINLCWPFVRSLPTDTIRRLALIKDIDTLVAEVTALFKPYFQSAMQHLDPALHARFGTDESTFFFASLELAVQAIASIEDKHTNYSHSIENLAFLTYELKQVMFSRMFRENETLVRERYEEHMKQHRSVDEDKESDPDLSPAEKVRVLRNGLQARIAWGYIDGGGEFVERRPIIYSQADLDMAEKLFELNRGFCVAPLLRLMDKCVATKVYGSFDWSEKFHASHGYNLGFFLKFIVKIAAEYEVTDMNGWVGLPEEPKAKKKKTPGS